MKVIDIYNILNSVAPFDKQCSWDNSGLLCGDPEKEVKKIGFALDATVDCIKQASKLGCDLLVVHHPVIFKPITNIEKGSPVELLIKNDIAIICAHTCLDRAENGVNYTLCKKLGLTDIHRFPSDGESEMCFCGEIGETTSKDFAGLVAKKLKAVVKYNNTDKPIKKVGVCGGCGDDFIFEMAKKGIDAFVTGEVSHHKFLDANELGITVIEAGHFETENPVVEYLYNLIKSNTQADCIILEQSSPAVFTGENYAS